MTMTTESSVRAHEASPQDAPVTGTADEGGGDRPDPAEDVTWAEDKTWGKALSDEEFSRAIRRVLGRTSTWSA